MTRKVPFTEYNEFISALDTFTMNLISLFISDKSRATSEVITSLVDFVERFNELYNRCKLNSNDKQLVLSYFTADGIKDTVDEAFEVKLAPVLISGISELIIRNLDCMLNNSAPTRFNRSDLRRWFNDMITTGEM